METELKAANGGRETRLLIITVAVSVITLLLLSRLRFPQQPATDAQAPTQPLERLAASATYDELASILRGVDRQVAGAIFAVRAMPDIPGAPFVDGVPVYVPAVRIAEDRAIAFPGPGRRIGTGNTASGDDVELVAEDNPRGLALLRIPARKSIPRLAVLDELPASPGYLAGIEATRAGPAVRPLYFGRLDRVTDPRWREPVLRLSALQQLLPAGAAVFTLEARFVGVGFPEGRDFIVVPGVTLLAETERLALGGSVLSADLGIEVQPLDANLRAATGAESGVVVTFASPTGPSAGQLSPADVLTGVAGQRITSPAEYAAALTQLAAGAPVTLDVVRAGTARTVTVTPVSKGSIPPHSAGDLGLELRAVRGAGSEVVRVTPRSVAALAGISAGDLITGMADVDAPQPAAIARTFARASSGSRIVMRIERGSNHVIVALLKP